MKKRHRIKLAKSLVNIARALAKSADAKDEDWFQSEHADSDLHRLNDVLRELTKLVSEVSDTPGAPPEGTREKLVGSMRFAYQRLGRFLNTHCGGVDA